MCADTRTMQGSKHSIFPMNGMRVRIQVFQFKTNGAACRSAGDSEIPDDEPQPGSQFRNVGAVGVGGANNSSRNLRVSSYDGTVEGVCKFSIDGKPIADRTNGTAWAQCSSACYIMVAFSCRCVLLVPFAAGCHVVVLF